MRNNATPLLEDPAFLADLDGGITQSAIATKWDVSVATVSKYRNRRQKAAASSDAAVSGEVTQAKVEVGPEGGSFENVRSADPITDWSDVFRQFNLDPEAFVIVDDTVRMSMWQQSKRTDDGDRDVINLYSYSARFTRVGSKESGGPAWPVIQPGPPVKIKALKPTPRATKYETAVLIADTQIGFRALDDGSLEPFHDEAAMNVALQIIGIENPHQTVLMGDIVDLASQGRFAQEAGFARTTQPAIDRTTIFAAEMRAHTDGQIVWIEGNHDKRMQNFVEANALAAFGLRKGASAPDAWPVMSLPNLLRLDETNIIYRDAYPSSHWWVNDRLRCEHGTKSNSAGSTAAQYMNDTPHISRAHGHTHRLELQSKTTYDRAGKIRSLAVNPGCLCRVDGAVPSVNGAIDARGQSATVHENWQQGVAVVRYLPGDGEFFVDLVQIDDGHTIYQGQEITSLVAH